VSSEYSLQTQFGLVEHFKSLPSTKPGAFPDLDITPRKNNRTTTATTKIDKKINIIFMLHLLK